MPHAVVRPHPTRPSPGARRFGYTVAVVVNLALLFALNRSPGWDVLPFLSDETTAVLGWVNASLAAGAVANLVYAAHDPTWLRAAGEALTTSIGIVAIVRIWQVYPFTPDVTGSTWDLVVRTVLAFALVGSVIAVVTALFGLARPASAPRRRGGPWSSAPR